MAQEERPQLLLKLPDELIDMTVGHVDPKSALLPLLQTCSRMQVLTEPHVYRYIFIQGPRATRCVLRALKGRVQRAHAVRSLYVTYDRTFSHDYNAMFEILKSCKKLNEIVFESGQCSDISLGLDWDGHAMPTSILRCFLGADRLTPPSGLREPLFQNLLSLTLNMEGPPFPYITIDEDNVSIFRLMNLRYLKLLCAGIGDEFPDQQGLHGTTQLKELILDDCTFSPEGLRRVLLLPKALKKLHIGESFQRSFLHFVEDRGLQRCNALFVQYPHSTMQALAAQASHLEELTFSTRNDHSIFREVPQDFDGSFIQFERLERVNLINQSPELEHIVMSQLPPRLRQLRHISEVPFHPEHKRRAILPPNLDVRNGIHVPFLRAESTNDTSSLERIDVVIDAPHWRLCMEDSTAIRNCIVTAGAASKRMGVDLRVFYLPASMYVSPVVGKELEEALLIYGPDTPLVELSELTVLEEPHDDLDVERVTLALQADEVTGMNWPESQE